MDINPISPSDWLVVAESAFNASLRIRGTNRRSAASRAYYGCFAACHAIMLHLRPNVGWPDRGKFKHGNLPSELRWTLRHHAAGRFGDVQVDIYRDHLETAYALRIIADYKPTHELHDEAVTQGVEAADALVRLARSTL